MWLPVLISGILMITGLLTAFFWWQINLRPVSNVNAEPVIIVVKKGQATGETAEALKKAGLIRSPLVFKLWVRQQGLGTKMQAGTFKLSPSMSLPEIGREMTQGTLDVWVTLKEGSRREEMAEAIEKAYKEQGITFDKQQFLALTANKEGYLFPDTYLMAVEATPAQLVSMLENTLMKKIEGEILTEIGKSGRSLQEVMIMASLVEREARGYEDRQKVAGILWKRLQNDWLLQVDATLQYALGYDRNKETWWPVPTGAHKSIASPYNTYQNAGLPPTPISNPSLSSIKATVFPVETDYWFYISDRTGQTMHYAATLAEHNSNIDRYLR